ncbi:MAG TPA: YdcF family protein [Candidatus Saccharimonadales bacterium]|nr:YdcF family protein [Candidatus Saccharimonadales bacterium]
MHIVKWLLVAVLTVLLLLAVGFLSIGFYLSPQDKLEHADVIVAISGGETTSRTAEAVELYKAGYAPKLLFSGAAQDPTGPSNAAAMQKSAERQGVPSSDVLIEESAQNTAQNAEASANVLRSAGAQKIILVTSPYHQRRASLEFHRALGKPVKIINHSAPDHRWRKSAWWETPYSYNLTISELQKTIYVLTTKNGTNP